MVARYDGPSELRVVDLPEPLPAADEVLVDVVRPQIGARYGFKQNADASYEL